MILRLKTFLPIFALAAFVACLTFTVLWMQRVTRIVRPAAEAAGAREVFSSRDPFIVEMMTMGNTADVASIENDLRMMRLYDVGREFDDMERLLEN